MLRMAMQPRVDQTDEKLILPFNPAGGFTPGTFARGSSAPGVVPVLAPSYPIKASAGVTSGKVQRIQSPVSYALPSGAAQPTNPGVEVQHHQFYPQRAFSPQTTITQPDARMQHEQLYSQALYSPHAIIAHPRSATIPAMGSPHPSDAQTDDATTYYTAGGAPAHSRSPTIPAVHLPINNQQRELQFQQAITTQQRVSGYFGAPEPHDAQFNLRALNPQSTGGYAQFPSWSSTAIAQSSAQNRQTVYTPLPQSLALNSTPVMQQAGHLTLQPEVASKSVPPPHDDQVPALITQPKFDWTGDGCIVSHDPLLNNNGDTLYRFILDHMDPPSVKLHCFGSHFVTERRATRAAEKTKVVDFNFVIDLALSMTHGSGELYTFGDNIVVYRGEMVKEVGVMGPLQTVRDWARNYAASPKTGKEFKFEKVVSGIDMPKMRDAVNQIINSTGHSSFRNVYFTVGNSSIRIRADSTLMMMLSDGLIKFLLWIVLAYPFIWMYRRFGQQGGKWDVCRASFTCSRDPRDPPNTTGVPLGDGDWVKIWERTIRLGVGNRIQTTQPIYRPTANDSNGIVFG